MNRRLRRLLQLFGGWRAAAVVLAVHAGLLAYSAARHSPTIHEMAHLPAGICHWQFGMFELYRVNPPLPRMVAALPVLFCDPKTDWGNYQLHPLSRETIPMGVRFAKVNGARTLFLFTVARWACIPFGLLGAWTCYRWAGELWGKRAGLAALCLWCFDPMMLGHSALVMPDVPAAATGVFAAWRFSKWLRAPGWSRAATAGLALGVASLCKTTLLVFFALWPLAWLIFRIRRGVPGDRRSLYAPRDDRHDHSHRAPSQRDGTDAFGVTIMRSMMSTMAEPLQLFLVLVMAVYFINLGYAFRGSCQRLGGFHFQSRLLTGEPQVTPPKVGNRFQSGFLAGLPVALPRDYVQGIDCQRADFEHGDRSYLHGCWSPHGWWYYYLVGLGIKLPIGTIALLAMAIVASVGNVLSRISEGNGLRAVRRGPDAAKGSGPKVHEPPKANVAQPPSAVSASNAAHLPLSPEEGGGDGATRNQPAAPCANSHEFGYGALDELFLLLCGVGIFVLVSSQTGFSAHVRYAVPALPFFFIWCGKLFAGETASHSNPKRQRGGVFAGLPRWRFGLVWLCLLGAIVESLCVYPHSIAFFNRLIGGPAHGHEWLLNSNGAWAQDLVHLKEWVDRHPEARPLHLATVGWLDPTVLGIDYTIPRVGPSHPLTADERAAMSSGSPRETTFDHRSHHAPRDASASSDDNAYEVPQTWTDVRSLKNLGPQPGWYAIDVNFLHSGDWPARRPHWYSQTIAEQDLNYEYFRFFEPCDRVAYSYLIYHITREQSAAARRGLGLPP